MNEEFAIKLKTILDSSSIADVKANIKNLKKEVENSLSNVTVTVKSARTKASPLKTIVESNNAAAELEERLAAIKARQHEIETSTSEVYEVSDAGWAEYDKLNEEAIRLEEEIERVKNGTSDTNQAASELNEKIVEIKENTEETANNSRKFEFNIKGLDKNLNKALTKTRNILLSFIGVRSVYAGIRRAMSSYLAQNEELKNKLNACWYALGSLFAPVLEYVVNLFIKLVSYVDALVKALGFAGINMSKYGKASGKAAKEQKQLASFDEINNLGNPNDSGGGGAGNPFKDVDVKPEVVNFLMNLFKWLPTIIAGLGLIRFALKTIFDVLFNGLDPLTAIKNMGWALVIFGIITALNALVLYLQDPSWFNFGMIIAGIGAAIIGLGIAIGSTPAIVAGAITLVAGFLAAFWPQITSWIDKVIDYIDSGIEHIKEWLTNNLGAIGTLIGGALGSIWEVVKGFVQGVQTFLDGLFKGVKLIIDGIIQAFKGDLKGGIRTAWEGIKTIIKGAVNGIIDIINGMIRGAVGGVNSVIDAANSIHFSIPDWVPSWMGGGQRFGLNLNHVNAPQIPHLATGTNYVPNDMLAQLHQGEAVVPKAFNEDQYNNSEETNDLLRELIDVVGSKEFRAYISQREIGEASLNYQRSKQRIMGGGLV